MKENLVSVIMPCYNVGSYIATALESVTKQTYINWEIIVVDDCGPKDGTQEIVQSFSQQYPSKRIEFIKHQNNKGVGAARNTAIKYSSGEFIAVLDPDDYWCPDHLDKGLAKFKADEELAFYSSYAYIFYDLKPERSNEIEGFKDWELKAYPSILSIRNAIPNSSAILKKNIFDLIGLYEENIVLQYVADCDLWVRIAKEGLKSYIHKEPTIYYRKHSAGATSNSDKMDKAKHAFAVKHKDWLVLHWRRGLDAQIRRLFWLEQKLEKEQEERLQIEQRLRILEQTISKIKSLPVLKQLLQLKKRLN